MANNLKTTSMVWGSPGRYIQGANELWNLPTYTQNYGKKVFAIIDQFFFEQYKSKLGDLYKKNGDEFNAVSFSTECSDEQIAEFSKVAKEFKPCVVVGIGGGKTLDTSKAVADDLKVPVVVAPTSASTDAPTTALSVIYKPDGEHSHARKYKKNPDLVLVDSKIIAQAPVRFLVAGMGDTLSTYFEAGGVAASDSPALLGDEFGKFRRTLTAMAIAEVSYRVVVENGLQAKLAAERGAVSPALEAVIEANTLMSGLGVENTGVSVSHSICEGITSIPGAAKHSLHGEQVAFGVVCHMVAENTPRYMLDEVMRFMISVGLPITLKDLKVEATEENVRIIAKSSIENSYWGAHPTHVTIDSVYDIVMAADALGHAYYKNMST